MENIYKYLFLFMIVNFSFAKVEAQPYPAKAIRLVVPVPPGGSNDILSRITAQAMSPGLGQPVVIDTAPAPPA